MPVLDVAQQPVHVVDRGSGDAIVFLHAFPLQAAMWDYQVEALESTHRCVAVDLPGFGQSPGPVSPESASMARWADLVVGVLDALGVDSATMVGASMGGYLVMALLRHHPARVRQVVLAGTRATSDDAGAVSRRTNQQEQLRGGAEVGSLAKGLVEGQLSSGSMGRCELVEYVHALADGASPDGWIGALEAMKRRDDAMFVLRQAGRSGLRALVVVGELDRRTPLADAMSVRSLLKGDLAVVPNVGHLPNVEDPLAFNDAVAAFLGVTPAAPDDTTDAGDAGTAGDPVASEAAAPAVPSTDAAASTESSGS